MYSILASAGATPMAAMISAVDSTVSVLSTTHLQLYLTNFVDPPDHRSLRLSNLYHLVPGSWRLLPR